MNLTAHHWIAGQSVHPAAAPTFRATDPLAGTALEPAFAEATASEVDAACQAAARAFHELRGQPTSWRAELLRKIARTLDARRTPLLERARLETGLPDTRLNAELGRTCAQLRLFADLLDDGSWIDARIDHADPDRTPQPKPDIRSMRVPLGPVAVFGASNFPLAFSVAGGDTASALAAGCPVVFKAHPSHPGTSEWAVAALLDAASDADAPAGLFSLLHGATHQPGLALVRHPAIRAVGFTGSFKAAQALAAAAAARPEPIPVFAEMGSVNPQIFLPALLREDPQAAAENLFNSATLATGQFCTKPGLVLLVDGMECDNFLDAYSGLLEKSAPGPLLNSNIASRFAEDCMRLRNVSGVTVLAAAPESTEGGPSIAGRPIAFKISSTTLRNEPDLAAELFGPSILFVVHSDLQDLRETVRALPGQLAASLHGLPRELDVADPLLSALLDRAGRVIINGFPTGVELGHAMHHGGPFPATSDSRFTSVGTAALCRFTRPVCFQNWPPSLLPPELQDRNPLGLVRLVDGALLLPRSPA